MIRSVKQSNNVIRGDLAAGNIYKTIKEGSVYNISLSSNLSGYSEHELESYLRRNEHTLDSAVKEIEQISVSGLLISDKEINKLKLLLKSLESNVKAIQGELSFRQGRIFYDIEPIDKRIDNARQKGFHDYQTKLKRKRRKILIKTIASIVCVSFFIILIYYLTRGCTEASCWTFQRSEIPFGEYGGSVKLKVSKTAVIREGPSTDYSPICSVESGSLLRIKSFEDKQWGSIGNAKGWWLKIYSKDDKVGYIVDDFIEQYFKQQE